MTDTRWKRYLIVLIAFAAIPPVLTRMGFLGDFWFETLAKGVALAAMGLALNVVMGYAGQISLGHAALAGVGAFASGVLTAPDRFGLPFFLGALAAMTFAAGIAFLIGLPALRLKGVYLAVATMGFAFAMQESLFRAPFISRGSAGVELPRPLIGTFEFLRAGDYFALVLVLLLLVWVLDTNLTRSKLGRALQAIRADETIAASFGVDVTRYKLLAFTISGAIAGLAGAMYGHTVQFINAETFDFDQTIILVIIVVLGGLGSRVGVTSAAAFYVLFPAILVKLFGNKLLGWDFIIGAALLIYTISKHPGGLAEAVRHAREKKAARAVRDAAAGGATHDDTLADVPAMPDMPRPAGLPERTTEATGTALLSARDVTVSFGGLRAVDDVSIDVHRGRIVGLIGPNGAGKTTMFNAMSGALTPDGGRISLLGRDVSNAPAHVRAALGLGRSFQMIGLARDLSVTENLLLAQHMVAAYGTASALLGLGKAPRIERELRTRAREAIAALGFERYADTPVKNLSHGQQRIVEIACVLVTAPEIVMLDEPSAGMAPAAVEALAQRLHDMRDQLGRTLLVIEHNIPLVLDVCDELYVMNSGQLLAHGDPDEVVKRDEVVGAYLGEMVPA